MQSLLDHRQLKLQRPTDTRWLSLENASLFKAVLEHEGTEGEATTIGLSANQYTPSHSISSLMCLISLLVFPVFVKVLTSISSE